MRKRTLALVLAIVICLALAVPAFADGSNPSLTYEQQVPGGTITYAIVYYDTDNGTDIEWCISNISEGVTHADIPNRIVYQQDGVDYSGPVSISGSTFHYNTNLISVNIPEGTTELAYSMAFIGCTNLTHVTLPSTLTKINMMSFERCASLTQVNLPEGLKEIESQAFADCKSLPSITFPSTLTSIGVDAFDSCESLTSAQLPNGITTISAGVFSGCRALSNVTIPDGVTSIGNYAFNFCTSLPNIIIPNSVSSIGKQAFAFCRSLTEVTIPSGVTSIEESTFDGCTSLSSVTIPSSVTSIGVNAFNSCTSLTDVYYTGTEAQWNTIETRGAYGTYDFRGNLKDATIHYNSPMPEQPTAPDTPSTTLPTVENIPAAGTAVARTQNVLLDGKKVEFQCYALLDAKGNPSNYVKIRDLALALNGTKAQFNVGWDGSKIVIETGKAYRANGSENKTTYAEDQKYESVSGNALSFNGQSVNLTSINIQNGNTYYKLRDLGQLMNFNVMWNGSSVVVETDKPYTG